METIPGSSGLDRCRACQKPFADASRAAMTTTTARKSVRSPNSTSTGWQRAEREHRSGNEIIARVSHHYRFHSFQAAWQTGSYETTILHIATSTYDLPTLPSRLSALALGSCQPRLIARTRSPKQSAAPTSAAGAEGSCIRFAITTIAAPSKAATA